MAMFANPVLAIPSIRSNTLCGLATTGPQRVRQLPTVAESYYPGFECSTWYGFLGPAGMPRAVAERIHADTRRVLTTGPMHERLAAMGMEVLEDGPEAFSRRMAAELARWTGVIRDAGIRME